MKRYLLFIFLISALGCQHLAYSPSEPFDPLVDHVQPVNFDEFRFFPPTGTNWIMSINERKIPVLVGKKGSNEKLSKYFGLWDWGVVHEKLKIFKQMNKSEKDEELQINVSRLEFSVMHFQTEDLPDFIPDYHNYPKALAINTVKNETLDINILSQQVSGMSCVRGRFLRQYKDEAFKFYFQRFMCIHPRHSNLLIAISIVQKVLFDQEPSEVQTEIDHFFNNLKIVVE
jgi:hypothetical protein